MGLYDRLKSWMTFPDVDVSSYECTDCDVFLSSRREECPQCGGDVTMVDPDLSLYYWDPMD